MRLTSLLAGVAAIAASCLSADARSLRIKNNSTLLTRDRRHVAKEHISPTEGMSTCILSVFGLEGNPIKDLKIYIMDMGTGKIYDTKTTDARGDVFIFATEKRSHEKTKDMTFTPSRTEPNKRYGIMWDYLPGKVVSDSKMQINEFFTDTSKVIYYKYFVDRVKVGKLPEAGIVQKVPVIASWWTEPVPIHDGRMTNLGWVPNWEKNLSMVEIRIIDENGFPVVGSSAVLRFLGWKEEVPPTDYTGTSFSLWKNDWDKKTYDIYIEQPKGKLEHKNKFRAHRFKDRWAVYLYRINRAAEPMATIPLPAYVRGVVIDQNKKPVPNHRVTIRDVTGLVVAVVVSDHNGLVDLHLSSGTYYIHPISKEADPENENYSIPLVLVRGVKKENIEIPNFVASAGLVPKVYTFLAANGSPLVDQLIVIRDSKNVAVFAGTTDENGKLEIALPNGQYTGHWTVAHLSGTFPFAVKGQDATVNTNAPHMVNLSYRFTAPDGSPLVNLDIVIKDSKGNIVATGKTDADGNVSFELPAGIYTVHPNYPAGQIPVGGGSFILDLTKPGSGGHTDMTIPITSGDSYTGSGTVEIDELPDIESRVHGVIYKDNNDNSIVDAGEPIAGAKVSLINSKNENVGTLLTSATGEYSFDSLSAGDYIISVDRSSIVGIPAGDPITRAIKAESGSQIKFDFRLQFAAAVTHSNVNGIVYIDENKNRIREPTEKTQAGAILSLTSADKLTAFSKTTGEDGKVEMLNVPYGKYFIELNLSAVPEFAGSQIAQWIEVKSPKINFGFALQKL